MIPVFDSFQFSFDLVVLLAILVPALSLVRGGFGRRALISLSGVYLLFLIAPRLAVFHVLFWLLIAAVQPLVSRTGETKAGPWVLGGALLAPLVPVVLWKVWPVEFVVEFNVLSNGIIRQLSSWLTVVDLTAPIIGPVGLSFSAFRAADLLIKSNLGLVDRLSPGRVLAYGSFAPLLTVGPIATYGEVAKTLEQRVPIDPRRGVDGTLHIVAGLVKLWVVAAPLAWSTEIFAVADSNSVPRLWIGLIAYGWYFYANFAGYSDIAVGAGRLMGGNIQENFARPYFQTSPSAFWNSWHISLTRFLRVNVFTPITMGRPSRQAAAAMLTMLLIGLWHGVNLAAVVFGLYHGVSLLIHRRVSAARPAPADRPMVVRVGLSAAIFIWFTLSLPLIELDLGEAADFYRALLVGGRFT